MTQPIIIRLGLDAGNLLTGAAAASSRLDALLNAAKRAGGGLGDSAAQGSAAAAKAIADLTARIDASNASFQRLRESGKLTAEQLERLDAIRQRQLVNPLSQQRETLTQQRGDLALAGARNALGVRDFAVIRAEIAQVDAAYKALAASGKASADELANADRARAAAIARLRSEMGIVQQSAAPAQRAIERIGQAGQASAGQTRAAMGQLPAQFTDIVTSLQGGQSPLTVLIQQGGQIRDSFGSVGGALRGIGSLIGPVLTNPITLAAAAATAMGAAFLAGRAESAALARSIIVTGNAAGITADQLGDMAKRLGDASGTQGAAAEALGLLVTAGGVAAGSLERVAGAALKLEKAGGPAVAETAKQFALLGKDPLAASVRLNESTNYLTASVVRQIKALQDQGNTVEAARVAQEAYATSLEQRAPQLESQLGIIQRGWLSIKTAASEAWDSMLNIGRQQTGDERLTELGERLARLQARERELYGDKGAPTGGNLAKTIAATQAELAGLQQAQKFKADAASADKARVSETAAAVEQTTAGHISALASLTKAGSDLRLARARAAADEQQAAVEQAAQRGIITEREAFEAKRQIDLKRIASEEQALNAAKAAAAAQPRGKAGSAEDLSRQAALLGIEGQRVALIARRNVLERAQFNVEPNITAGANLFSTPDDSAAILARVQASRTASDALADDNRTRNLALIRDDEARGRRQIEIEAEAIRQKLDLAALGDDARREAEARLAEFVRLRNEQLADDLKPSWQKLIEGWADTTKLMRDSADRLGSAVVQAGEDAFVEFARTGKLQVKGLVDTILAEFARVQYRKLLASASEKGGGDVLGGLLQIGAQFLGANAGAYNGTQGGINGGATVLPASLRGGNNYSDGGPVSGPGTGTSDDILARLSDGEFVLRAAAVRKLGLGLLQRLNHADRVPAFAAGGLVGSAPALSGSSAAGGNIVYRGGPIQIDARSDQAQIAQLVAGAQAQERRAFMAELKARGVLR